ncbi:hypothetical protein DPMN_119762 [Dreissena polymorpha]|uniref:Uncharacterized protein n=1 Tax=Dreissena polymorpha TaxID=45954 RepID=A0A9D4JMZ6_DREPO|nr:hypothetical protein DPMN_119762 [Dreissena polymorpha]
MFSNDVLTDRCPCINLHYKEKASLKLSRDSIWTNILTKFQEEWRQNMANRASTRFYYSHITGQKQYTPDLSIRGHKNCPPNGSHVFQQTKTIFELSPLTLLENMF